MIEHVPNLISWLQGLFLALKPGGSLFLVIPDKRYTFDFQRPLTTFGQLLEDFLSERQHPSVATIYDHYSSAVELEGSNVWAGLIENADLIPMFPKRLPEIAQDVHKNQNYHDVHVSTFTPWSFFDNRAFN